MDTSNGVMLQDIVRTTIGKWSNEDYNACEHIEELLNSKGWEVLQSLWKNLEESVWQRIQKETDDGVERNIYRLIGIREGMMLATSIHLKVLIEKEQQKKIAEREMKRALEEAAQNSERMDLDGQ